MKAWPKSFFTVGRLSGGGGNAVQVNACGLHGRV
jgi:hypothetical protein